MTVSILGNDIEVYYVSQLDLTKRTKDKDSLGFWDGEAIYVLETLSEHRKKRIFTHEVIHAIFSLTGLTKMMEEKLEEAICDALECLELHA